jgi:hypothetical protein
LMLASKCPARDLAPGSTAATLKRQIRLKTQ